MMPAASVSALVFAHPDASYFAVGKVQKDQVDSYAKRKCMELEVCERWLSPILNYDRSIHPPSPSRAACRTAPRLTIGFIDSSGQEPREGYPHRCTHAGERLLTPYPRGIRYIRYLPEAVAVLSATNHHTGLHAVSQSATVEVETSTTQQQCS